MYIIAYLDNNISGNPLVEVVCGDPPSVYSLVKMLEKFDVEFKVSNRFHCLTPNDFGWDNFTHWLCGV